MNLKKENSATVKISESQKKILEAVSKNPFVTQEGLAGIIGIHVVNIKKNRKISRIWNVETRWF